MLGNVILANGGFKPNLTYSISNLKVKNVEWFNSNLGDLEFQPQRRADNGLTKVGTWFSLQRVEFFPFRTAFLRPANNNQFQCGGSYLAKGEEF